MMQWNKNLDGSCVWSSEKRFPIRWFGAASGLYWLKVSQWKEREVSVGCRGFAAWLVTMSDYLKC